MAKPADLTEPQWQAVNHLDGPLLVLAGPGSGKTRVITRRIARMVERGVSPHEILAITFTNKAANEMAERVGQLLPGTRTWVSTFHRFCAWLLRQRTDAIGLRPNYSIYDTSAQRQLVKQILLDLDFDAVHFSPRKIIALISNAKNELISAETFQQAHANQVGNHLHAVAAQVYPAYQKRLLEANAVDFDDLLLHAVSLLEDNPEIRQQFDERFRYILVDEYQDTNLAQYKIVAALSQNNPNLCVTGDPDQSIYGWRGARIDNILRFESDYPQSTVVRLEQSFRSTQRIVQAADRLIGHNQQRKAKQLVTDNPDGDPVELLSFADARQEADYIATHIKKLVDKGDFQYSDVAIFYRVNALSRQLELAFTRHHIPHRVAAGVAFYERAEVRDLLAYLSLIHNPQDEIAFRRIVNTPRRGIGKQSVNKLMRWADMQEMQPLEAALKADQHPTLGTRPKKAISYFAKMIHNLSMSESGSVHALLEAVIDRSQYAATLKNSQNEQDRQRMSNIDELLNAAHHYDMMHPDDSTLEGFLEHTSLVSDTDDIDRSSGEVTLMTLHAAKGLEYPVVYLLGVEEGLIPHQRSIDSGDPNELEEERRLLFVGMTRAMNHLYLTQTQSRDHFGRPTYTIPSAFLTETELVIRDCSEGDLDDDFENFDAESSDFDISEFEVSSDDDESNVDDFERKKKTTWRKKAKSTSPRKSKSPGGLKLPKLMTGADLLNGTTSEVDVPKMFSVGTQVRHPRYGLGTILQLDGFARNRSVTVEFHELNETKSFRVEQCPLQPVGQQ